MKMHMNLKIIKEKEKNLFTKTLLINHKLRHLKNSLKWLSQEIEII